MLTLPFAQALGSLGGPSSDGVYVGTLPRVPFTAALAASRVITPLRVLRGDAASGAITYSDITAAALSAAAGDVPPFNSTEPATDELQLSLPASGELVAVLIEITTAGAGTGTWTPVVDYDDGAQDVAVALAASPPDFKAAGIAPLPDQTKIIGTRERRLRLRVSDVTTVTTAPLAGRIWLEMSGVAYSDRTALVAQNPSPLPSFASVGDAIPTVGDVDWLMLGGRFAKVFTTVLGARAAAHTMEWVYWNGSSIAALPAANIVDPTDRLATQPTTAYTSKDLLSTFVGTSWGNSGTFGDTGIAGDGYVEGRTIAPATAAGFLGLSIVDAGVTYTGIDYAWHFGHGGQALCSIWQDGVQQAGLTFALAVGDLLRVERRGSQFLFYQNGVLRFTSSSTPAGTYRPDTAFIASSGLTQIELVDRSRGYPVWVPFDWASTTAATATARSIQVPTAEERIITVHLPSDAAQLTVSGSTGHALGLRATAAPGALRPPHAVMRALALSGAGATGLRFTTARTFTRLALHCRTASLGAGRYLVVNASTGESVALDMPADTEYAEVDGSLSFAVNEALAIVQLFGHGTVEVTDGAFILQ